MSKLVMAQYGTKHGHAAGKLAAMIANPDVEVVGVFEPDRGRRDHLARRGGAYAQVRWLDDARQMLDDASISAIASEGLNAESLAQTEAIVDAGKHVWYDKPAGDDWGRWQRVVAKARRQGTLIQMGYMFRYHEGFRRIGQWARSGLLGNVFSVRAHMSTNLTEAARRVISVHQGGVWYDLAGHMLDQITWILGRPSKVTSFLRHDDDVLPGFVDNGLVVFEYDRSMAVVDIAAMEPEAFGARRYEVYGSEGSAILLEPFEPASQIRLCLNSAREGYATGAQVVPVNPQSRQSLYELELEAFVAALRGEKEPDRTLDHELLVQETLLRGSGVTAG